MASNWMSVRKRGHRHAGAVETNRGARLSGIAAASNPLIIHGHAACEAWLPGCLAAGMVAGVNRPGNTRVAEAQVF